MCTNFTPTRNNPWVKANFGIELPGQDYPVEAYPGFAAPIIMQSHSSGRVASGLARFGLIPSWAKDDKISRHTYNARAETVSEKPSYRSSWRQRRYAIALVDNFFEPNYITGKAQRWKIELAAQDPLPKEPFGIASLWDTWTHPTTGELITSFTMLTVNADTHPVMQQFHKPGDEKRTPVALAPNQYAQWLSATPEEAMKMMHCQAMPALYSQACPKIQ
jgi:putative SOS response-associated peptidase YedK